MKKSLVKLAAMVMAVISLLPLNVFADEQTAPVPEEISTVEDIVGTWVDDENARQPHVYEFWEEDGQLMYTHYEITPGNDNGIGIGKTYTKFEYHSGKANLMGHWGVVDCFRADSNVINSSFYHNPEKQTLTDAIKGKKVYHKADDFEYTLDK